MMDYTQFISIIWDYYQKNKRSFPWRETSDPYKVLVSEIMLQQTQTDRVVPKYEAFITRFPNFNALAQAPLSEVLLLWSGLGYNRRAMYLHRTAQIVSDTFNSLLPQDEAELRSLPGIGEYTAGAIQAFAYSKRAIFIETNIRRVFIHFFFPEEEKVSDDLLIPLIEKTLPSDSYKEWYYALMDYGVYIAKITVNPNRKSKQYTKQSKFEGSNRQLRGKILRLYLKEGVVNENHMILADHKKEDVYQVIQDLKREGLIDSD